MDTDQLTQMAYSCIILANHATDVLKSELGAACSKYKTEDEYLAGILKYVKEIEEDPKEYLDWWNLLDQTDLIAFLERIGALKQHIEKTIFTPLKDRGTPEWEEKINPDNQMRRGRRKRKTGRATSCEKTK